MTAISAGLARDANDPGFVSPSPGTSFGRTLPFSGGGPLATYLAAHGGGLLPGSCGAMTCPVGTGAYDSIDVRLKIRADSFFTGE